MEKIKCPYSKKDLTKIACGLDAKLTEEVKAKLTILVDQMADGMGTKQQVNATVAKENGITILDLINSPNYSLLVQEQYVERTKTFIRNLIDLGLTKKEAFALLAVAAKEVEYLM